MSESKSTTRWEYEDFVAQRKPKAVHHTRSSRTPCRALVSFRISQQADKFKNTSILSKCHGISYHALQWRQVLLLAVEFLFPGLSILVFSGAAWHCRKVEV
jgi:hypothetical protein